jgi:DNA-binding NarL/FixJ family response regulator
MNDPNVIRVLIADDFKILRDVIRLFLQGRGGGVQPGSFDVVGEAPALDDALEQARSLQPDVILMNDYLPPINSALATARFREQGMATPILIISLELDADLIQRSLASGANGVMGKDEIDTLLAEAIQRVHRGETYLSPEAKQRLADAAANGS